MLLFLSEFNFCLPLIVYQVITIRLIAGLKWTIPILCHIPTSTSVAALGALCQDVLP